MLATKIDPAITEQLTSDDFSDARHAAIWRAICTEVRNGGEDAPSLVVIDWLRQAGELELAGGIGYVDSFNNHTLSRNYGSSAQCAVMVKQCSRLRKIAANAKAAADAADGYGEG